MVTPTVGRGTQHSTETDPGESSRGPGGPMLTDTTETKHPPEGETLRAPVNAHTDQFHVSVLILYHIHVCDVSSNFSRFLADLRRLQSLPLKKSMMSTDRRSTTSDTSYPAEASGIMELRKDRPQRKH